MYVLEQQNQDKEWMRMDKCAVQFTAQIGFLQMLVFNLKLVDPHARSLISNVPFKLHACSCHELEYGRDLIQVKIISSNSKEFKLSSIFFVCYFTNIVGQVYLH